LDSIDLCEHKAAEQPNAEIADEAGQGISRITDGQQALPTAQDPDLTKPTRTLLSGLFPFIPVGRRR